MQLIIALKLRNQNNVCASMNKTVGSERTDLRGISSTLSYTDTFSIPASRRLPVSSYTSCLTRGSGVQSLCMEGMANSSLKWYTPNRGQKPFSPASTNTTVLISALYLLVTA